MPSMAPRSLAYRPEVDGLRALAVASVFVFHLDRQLLPGGFVGVDVFFVISGYLITRILIDDFDAGRFSLLRFYQHRIARIAPALFAVAMATTLIAGFVYLPQDFASTGANLAASALSVANIKLLFQGSYFAVSVDAQPLLHYWSLSVEEQYYLIFPLFLFLVASRWRRWLPLVLAGLVLLSLVAWLTLSQREPTWAFYLLPTRAWELGVGCLLATATKPGSPAKSEPYTQMASMLGMVLILGSVLFIRESRFPGATAVFPVLATAAVIGPRTSESNLVHRLLSWSPLVSIGRMSYSIYLWHWPVFSLVDYRYFGSGSFLRIALKLILSVVCAAVSYWFLEAPARLFLNADRNRKLAFFGLACAVAIAVAVGWQIRSRNYINAEPADVKAGGIAFAGRPGAPTVVLMGDSNGSMYGRLLRDVCGELGASLHVISVAAGEPLPDRQGGGALWLDSLAAVREIRPDYVVFAAAWSARLRSNPDGLDQALKRLRPLARHFVLLNQPPILPDEATRAAIREGAGPRFHEPTAVRDERIAANGYLVGLESDSVHVIDVAQHFVAEDQSLRFVDARGRQLYHDATHISDFGADQIRNDLIAALGRPNPKAGSGRPE